MAKQKLPRTEEEQQRLTRNRIGLILLFSIIGVILVALNSYIPNLMQQERLDTNLNIFFLINLNVIFLLFAFLLVLRNLVKVIYERRRRALGFRLKFKLTFAFFLVSALPMLVFFFIANGLLKNSVDFWFQSQFTSFLTTGNTAMQILHDQEMDRLRHQAKQLALEMETKGSARALRAVLEEGVKHLDLDALVLYDQNLIVKEKRFVSEVITLSWAPVSPDLDPGLIQNGIDLVTGFSGGEMHRYLIPFNWRGAKYYLEVSRALTGKRYEQLQEIRQGLADQRNLMTLQEPINTNFTFYLLLFTLLIVSASTWFGFYLSRSLVEPLESLVDGTERIAKGDLDFQLKLEGDDEIGQLIVAFDRMTNDLLEKRRELAHSQEELMHTYQVLEERNAFVEQVLLNIQSGIFFIDNEGIVKGVNPYMVQFSKIRSREVIGQHYSEILSEEEMKFFERLNRKLEISGESHIKEEAHISVYRRSVHISMELYQLKTQKQEPLGRLLVVSDLTELDRHTRAQAWREVARRIAHEIKNPLTPIQLSAQRIRRKYVDDSNHGELLDIATDTIINEVNHLKNMVNEFSKFAKIPEINPSPGSINEILQEVYNLFQSGSPAEIRLSLELDPSIPSLLLDREQIKRVFNNLLDNSIAAMKEGGEIRLISRYQAEMRTAVIEVIDEGHGVPREMLSRIFDPYVTTKKEGTGLGLAIVQQIVSDHGGFIRLDSIQKGTKFIIELPANYREA